MNVNGWEELGRLARKVGGTAGDPDANSYRDLFQLLLSIEEIRKKSGMRSDFSATLEIELKEDGWPQVFIKFASPPSNESLLELIDRLREICEKNPDMPPPHFRLPPEVREWALRQEYNEEDSAAELRELREKGGPDLAEVIRELEQEIHGERTQP